MKALHICLIDMYRNRNGVCVSTLHREIVLEKKKGTRRKDIKDSDSFCGTSWLLSKDLLSSKR